MPKSFKIPKTFKKYVPLLAILVVAVVAFLVSKWQHATEHFATSTKNPFLPSNTKVTRAVTPFRPTATATAPPPVATTTPTPPQPKPTTPPPTPSPTPAPAPAPKLCYTYDKKRGSFNQGYDTLEQHFGEMGTPTGCKSKCNSNPDCGAYVQSGTSRTNSSCFLYKGPVDVVPGNHPEYSMDIFVRRKDRC